MVVLAPVPTFYRIVKKKSTESFHSVPYVVGLFSATMWVYYGILTSDVLLLTINIAVCFIEVVYLFIFLLYAPAKSRVTSPPIRFMHTNFCKFSYHCTKLFS